MAATPRKKASGRTVRRKKKPAQSSRLTRKIFSWLLTLGFLLLSLGVTGYVVFFRTVQAAEIQDYSSAAVSDLVFEEPNPPEHHHMPTPSDSADTSTIPRVAIIIDDMGYHQKEGEKLLAIPYALTFSFLPYAPYMDEAMETAYQGGKTILLHLPMQPKSEKWNAGEGALLVEAERAERMQLLKNNLSRVQYATGVNNHMGSLFTEQPEPMRCVMQYLKENQLFWVDSFTTSQSVGFSIAHEMGVKTARRHVFLDNQQQPEKICEQLDKLVLYAEKKGSGIAIGHPYPETVEALQTCLPKYDERVTVVGVNELVN